MVDTIIHRWFGLPYRLKMHRYGNKKSPKCVLFLHGIGSSSSLWDGVLQQLPKGTQAVTVDLLGFGDSPRPTWATYSAKAQARAVVATYFRYNRPRKLVIVGHSMGALVAVEIVKRYPRLVDSIILCSPPFYASATTGSKQPRPDKILRELYRRAIKHPEEFIKLSGFMTKHELINPGFNVDASNVSSYLSALEAMIINQTSLEDARQLQVPTHIIRGNLDPVVLRKNIRTLVKSNPNITAQTVTSGHEIKGAFTAAILAQLKAITHQTSPKK